MIIIKAVYYSPITCTRRIGYYSHSDGDTLPEMGKVRRIVSYDDSETRVIYNLASTEEAISFFQEEIAKQETRGERAALSWCRRYGIQVDFDPSLCNRHQRKHWT